MVIVWLHGSYAVPQLNFVVLIEIRICIAMVRSEVRIDCTYRYNGPSYHEMVKTSVPDEERFRYLSCIKP